jgi:hypothetical protein
MRFLLLLPALLIFSAGNALAATVQKGFTAKDMREAIIRGGVEKAWRMTDAGANTVEAAVTVRNRHVVVVTISYTATSFDIKYKNSENMAYKPRDDGAFSIHPNYHKWVRTLEDAIHKQLALKQAGK